MERQQVSSYDNINMLRRFTDNNSTYPDGIKNRKKYIDVQIPNMI